LLCATAVAVMCSEHSKNHIPVSTDAEEEPRLRNGGQKPCLNWGYMYLGRCKCPHAAFSGDYCEKYPKRKCGGEFGPCWQKDGPAYCMFSDLYCRDLDSNFYPDSPCRGYCLPIQQVDWLEGPVHI
ncbi:hypothetical protein PMAYCL1PPCAC_21507, partial [Pristionchus mayeri]